MENEFFSWLGSENSAVVHAGILILLVLGGLGFPIPEDIPLILAGVLGNKGIVALQAVFVTCYLGVLIGDQTMYFFGHYFGHKLLNAGTRSRFFPAITEEKVNEIRDGLRRRRLLYIFVGRHLFPIRSMTFITAGALRVPFWEFLLADGAAALISVTVMIGIGYLLGSTLPPEAVTHFAESVHWYVAGIVLVMCLACFVGSRISAGRRHGGNKQSEVQSK